MSSLGTFSTQNMELLGSLTLSFAYGVEDFKFYLFLSIILMELTGIV